MPRIGIVCDQDQEREVIRHVIALLAAGEGFDCSVCSISVKGGALSEEDGDVSLKDGSFTLRSGGYVPADRNRKGEISSGGALMEGEYWKNLSCVILAWEDREAAFGHAEYLWQQEPSLLVIYVAHGVEDIIAALRMPFFHTVRIFDLEQDLKTAFRKMSRLKGTSRDKIAFHQNGKVILISRKEIYFLESEHHDIRLHAGREVFAIGETLSQCEEKLKGMGFVRTYRSFLVNMYHIRCLEKENVLLDNGERLYVSRRRYPEVKLTFENYIRHLDFMR